MARRKKELQSMHSGPFILILTAIPFAIRYDTFINLRKKLHKGTVCSKSGNEHDSWYAFACGIRGRGNCRTACSAGSASVLLSHCTTDKFTSRYAIKIVKFDRDMTQAYFENKKAQFVLKAKTFITKRCGLSYKKAAPKSFHPPLYPHFVIHFLLSKIQ